MVVTAHKNKESLVLSFSSASEKTVHYLIAADGNPWVWVLGEDEEDEKKDIGELLRSKC